MSRVKKRTRGPATKPRARTARYAIRVVALAACIGVVVWLAMRARSPQPPEVPLAIVDPALASLIETSRSAVVQSPKSGAAWGRLGQVLEAAEFVPQAMFCYSNAAVLAPADLRWPYLLGLQQLARDENRALQNLQRAVQIGGERSNGARLQLARALIERGRYDDAESHLRILLAAEPNHAAARAELARVYLGRGALKEASQELQYALTNQYTARPAMLIAAQLAQRNRQNDLASHLARRAASMPRPFDWPDPVLREVQSLRVDRARLADQVNALLQQQRLAEAEPLALRLANMFPNDPEVILLLGRLRYLEKRCGEAESYFLKYLEQQTNSLNGLIQLGLSLLCQQRWTNAVAVLERAVTLKPDFAQAHSNLGLARSRAGDSAGAIRAYRDALRCHPGDVNSHIALAEELANAGDLQEAKKHIERAAAINPNDARIQAAREQLSRPQ